MVDHQHSGFFTGTRNLTAQKSGEIYDRQEVATDIGYSTNPWLRKWNTRKLWHIKNFNYFIKWRKQAAVAHAKGYS
jgi:hypothetical protein